MHDVAELISSAFSTVVLVFLAVGLHYRHRRRVHIPIMLGCFAVDLANVVYIEVRRGAGGKGGTTLGTAGEWGLQFHIAVSVLTLLGYAVALYTGIRLWRAHGGRRLHRANAAAFLMARVLNYVTSFYV